VISRLNSIVALFMAAVYSALGTGNATIHHFAAGQKCACFSAVQPVRLDHCACPCGQHSDGHESPPDAAIIADLSECSICQFFRMAVVNPSMLDAVSFGVPNRPNWVTASLAPDSATELVYWSRGPPWMS
jgi:hypothetical protein